MLRKLLAALLAAAVLYCASVPASAASKRDTKVELDLRPDLRGREYLERIIPDFSKKRSAAIRKHMTRYRKVHKSDLLEDAQAAIHLAL